MAGKRKLGSGVWEREGEAHVIDNVRHSTPWTWQSGDWVAEENENISVCSASGHEAKIKQE